MAKWRVRVVSPDLHVGEQYVTVYANTIVGAKSQAEAQYHGKADDIKEIYETSGNVVRQSDDDGCGIVALLCIGGVIVVISGTIQLVQFLLLHWIFWVPPIIFFSLISLAFKYWANDN
tara:strand:- start:59 stop:412 length:354 start_codon:yes stop_codon:yes gene_type:complete